MPATDPRAVYYAAKSLLRARWMLERMTADDAFSAFEAKADLGAPLHELPSATLRAVAATSRVEVRDELEAQRDCRPLGRWLAPGQSMLGRNAPLPG